MSEQRTQEWYNERLGKFTASEIHKLLGKQGLGKTGETYCFEKATELVFGIDEEESFESWDMRRGITLEPVAFEKFRELKYFDFIDVEKAYFFPYKDYAGASPDGVTSDGGILEIKCPRSAKLFNLINKGKEAIDFEYLAQMQMQMFCSNSTHAYFFNYILFQRKPMWHEIIVERDNDMIGLIDERLDSAVKLRDEFVQYLIEKKQF